MIKTLFEAVLLVVIVIVLFLQSWRAAIIPIVAIPVSIVGSFFVLEAFGFSINNLTLFGLVLAIGIVVDDAIVVVENVERYLRQGLSPRDAAHKTMDEVGSALMAIGLVLCAVFIPTAFITGISGAFYRQFALTITASTIISVILSLTLSPALAALFLRPHDQEPRRGFWKTVALPFDVFFAGFNKGFEKLASSYAGLTRRVLRVSGLMLVLYGVLIGLTYFEFSRAPSGFIPQLDRGYFIAVFSLAAGIEPGPHRPRRARGIRHSAVAARRRQYRDVRRLRWRDVYQRAQFGRHFRHLEAVRGAGQSRPRDGDDPQRFARPDAGLARGVDPHPAAALGARASAPAAVSSCMCRTAPIAARTRSNRPSPRSRGRPIGRPA